MYEELRHETANRPGPGMLLLGRRLRRGAAEGEEGRRTEIFLAGASAEAQQKAKKEDVPKYIKQLTAKDAKERIAACEALAEIGELKKAYAKDAYEPLAHAVSKDGDAACGPRRPRLSDASTPTRPRRCPP
jgi:hypothetical protein